MHLRDNRGRVAILLGINNAKFRRPVKPGDVLILKATVLHLSSKGGKVAAGAYVDDVLVAESELSFALVYKDQI